MQNLIVNAKHSMLKFNLNSLKDNNRTFQNFYCNKNNDFVCCV